MPHKPGTVLLDALPPPDADTFTAHSRIQEEEQPHDVTVSGFANQHGHVTDGTNTDDVEYAVIVYSENLFADLWSEPEELASDKARQQKEMMARLAALKSTKSLRVRKSSRALRDTGEAEVKAETGPSENDATRYEGQLMHGVPHGHGCFFVFGGVVGRFEGQIRNGRADGLGTFTGLAIRYEGQWQNGYRHGVGFMIYERREVYIGEWQQGQRHGYGLAISQKGKVHFSRWEYDADTGFPIMLTDDAVPSSGMLTYREREEHEYDADQAVPGETMAEAALRRLHRTGGTHLVPHEAITGFLGDGTDAGDATRRRRSGRRITQGSIAYSSSGAESLSQTSRSQALTTRGYGFADVDTAVATSGLAFDAADGDGGGRYIRDAPTATPIKTPAPRTGSNASLLRAESNASLARAGKPKGPDGEGGVNVLALTQHRTSPKPFETTYRDFQRYGFHRPRQQPKPEKPGEGGRKTRGKTRDAGASTAATTDDRRPGSRGKSRGGVHGGLLPSQRATTASRVGSASGLRPGSGSILHRPGSGNSLHRPGSGTALRRPGSGSVLRPPSSGRHLQSERSRRRVTLELEPDVLGEGATSGRDSARSRGSARSGHSARGILRTPSREPGTGPLGDLGGSLMPPASPITLGGITGADGGGYAPQQAPRVRLVGEDAARDGGLVRRGAFPEMTRTTPVPAPSGSAKELLAALRDQESDGGGEGEEKGQAASGSTGNSKDGGSGDDGAEEGSDDGAEQGSDDGMEEGSDDGVEEGSSDGSNGDGEGKASTAVVTTPAPAPAPSPAPESAPEGDSDADGAARAVALMTIRKRLKPMALLRRAAQAVGAVVHLSTSEERKAARAKRAAEARAKREKRAAAAAAKRAKRQVHEEKVRDRVNVGGEAPPEVAALIPLPQQLPGYEEAEELRQEMLVSNGGLYHAFVPFRVPKRRGSLNAFVNPHGNLVVPIDRFHAPPPKVASHHVLKCRNAVRAACAQLPELVTAKQRAMLARLYTQRVQAEAKRGPETRERKEKRRKVQETIGLSNDRKYLANRVITDSSHGTSIARRERIDLIRRIKQRLPLAKQLEMDVLQTRQQKALATERRAQANSLVREVERLKAKLIGIGVSQKEIEEALTKRRGLKGRLSQ